MEKPRKKEIKLYPADFIKEGEEYNQGRADMEKYYKHILSRQRKTIKELKSLIYRIRPRATCYDRVCKTLGIKNDILGFVKKQKDHILSRLPGEDEIYRKVRLALGFLGVIDEISARIGKPNYKPNYNDSRKLNIVYKKLALVPRDVAKVLSKRLKEIK